MVHHEHIEQQHREREEVSLCAWTCIASHNLRGHETHRAIDTTASSVIDGHIIVIADQDFTCSRVEKNVTERDVSITQTLGVQLQKAMCQFPACGRQGTEARLNTAFHQIHHTL